MADIRIKDLATTATTTASDDFMAVDGSTNGTRKMNAAAPAFLTSVTTPSLTSPAATNLTLGLGTGGTALTLTSSTLAATFAGNVNINGSGTSYIESLRSSVIGGSPRFQIESSSSPYYSSSIALIGNANSSGNEVALTFAKSRGTTNGSVTALISGDTIGGLYWTGADGTSLNTNAAAYLAQVDGAVSTGVVPIRYVWQVAASEKMRLSSNGTLSISSSTAGSAGAGALVLTTGGLATGAASYIGGGLTVNGTITSTAGNNAALFLSTTATTGYQYYAVQSTGAGLRIGIENDAGGALVAGSSPYDTFIGTANATGLTLSTNGTKRFRIDEAGAANFAGTVTSTGGLTASSWSLLGAGVWPTTTMGQNGSRVVSSSATENQLFTILNMNTAASGAVGINYGASIYLGARGTDNTADMAIAEIFGARESATSGNLTSYLSFKTSNSIGSRTEALRLASTGAATFGGAVSITGNVGFYGQAATAKPMGVAVTAAAIHAALVTLNLIAA